MTKPNAANERIKREYFRYLAEGRQPERQQSSYYTGSRIRTLLLSGQGGRKVLPTGRAVDLGCLMYRPDLDWLKSGEAALSLTKARAVAATATGNHLVFAPAKFVSRELLTRERIDVDYAPLPFALYRLETA